MRHPGCALRDRHAAAARRRVPAGARQLRHARPRPRIARSDGQRLGLRNLSFEVGDLDAVVDEVARDGYGLVGGIGEYENTVRMAYVRGPEGIIVSLFEQIG